MNIVIVESPAKAKTINKYLGSDYEVLASYGHVRDLPKRTLGLDVLRCETVRGVKKELLVFALVYNLVRAVMLEASRRQEVPLDRISFIDALRWLATARPDADQDERRSQERHDLPPGALLPWIFGRRRSEGSLTATSHLHG